MKLYLKVYTLGDWLLVVFYHQIDGVHIVVWVWITFTQTNCTDGEDIVA